MKRLSKLRSDVDMTTGPIYSHLIRFAVPLMFGSLFQQLYNTVDTWVVGNYVGNEAFSAVGSVGSIVNMLISLFLGLSTGASVVISQYYGAKQYDKVRQTIHTALVATVIIGVVFTGLGILLAPYLLRMMNTPDNVFPESMAYLTIYFAGILGLMIYNMGAGILRAVGDSRRPFYFLVVCALVNTALDLFFVLVCGMGVEGVALATIIAQAVSAVLVILSLIHSDSTIRLQWSALRITRDPLKRIISIGLPAAIQQAVTAFSNVFVQSYINVFGADFMSGWTAYGKIDQLLLLPMSALAMASTTFVGQNLGCGQVDRTKKGIRAANILSVAVTAVLFAGIILPFAPYLVAFFNDRPAVVEYGTMFLRWISPFYLLCCYNQVVAGALRGAGHSKETTIITLASFVAFRQVYMFIMANYISNTVLPLTMAYPAGWVLCTILLFFYYRKADLTKNAVVKPAKS